MRSAFFGLNLALQALMAQRKALDVSAQNVANANTEGYSRQEAVMKASAPFTAPTANRSVEAGQMGTGVEIQQIRQIRDEFLDSQIRGQLAKQGNWDTKESYLAGIESILNEPSDSGIASQLSKMWASWQDLSTNPSSYVARAAVVQNASVLTDTLRRDADLLSDLRDQADSQIGERVEEINDWLSEIASLNTQIVQVQIVGDEANDLKDERSLLLDKLAKAVQIAYDEQTDGSVTVTLNSAAGETLVSASTAYSLRENGAMGPIERDDGTGTWTVVTIQDGEMKGMLDLRDDTLDSASANSLMWRLDMLAQALVDTVDANSINVVHAAGYALTAAGPTSFFTGTGASDIQVNTTIAGDPNLIRAAQTETSVGSGVGLSGDGSNALAVGRLQSATVTSLSNATVEDWYKELIAELGIDSQQAKAMASNQKLVVGHLTKNRESFSGVSLDEEASNMIRFQRAYEAAARMMTVMDQMLDTLINGMGVVGR